MNTTFIINGGAGRVITSIPALEKYHRRNPNDDFKVLVYGWESLFWSHPLLQSRTFPINQKGLFDQVIKPSRVICPEPYFSYNYYNQKISLAEAFDEIINNTDDHSDLLPPDLYVSNFEMQSIKYLTSIKKNELNKSKIVVIQPYGSGLTIVNNRPYDSSHRSMDADQYLKLIHTLNEMNKDVLIFFFGEEKFRHPGDNISLNLSDATIDLRFYMALINECDYFVGCDSVGQHIARAFNKKGLVLMGSTSEINVSYPDYFTIFRTKKTPTYSPIRLVGVDCEFSDRLNDGIMNYSDSDIEKIAQIINRNLYE